MPREIASRYSPPDPNRVFGRTLLLMGLALVGCGKKEKEKVLVLATASVTAPPILRSEADQIVIPVRVDAPLRFENRSNAEQFVTVSKTGCSCYGMATADEFLKKDELVGIPARSSRDLFFVAKEFQGEAEQGFRVGFQVGASSEFSPGEELQADCSMEIFPDLVLEPASIVIDESGKEASESGHYEVTIKRMTRGKPVALALPQFSMSPPLLTAQPARPEKAPEEIAPGLWRTVWKSTLKPDLPPAEARENGGRFAFTFEFPEGASMETVSPRHAGGIPTILEAVRSDPRRKVAGQLILRRSKGIIAPAQLHFGAIPAGSGPRTRRLILTAADHRPFQVTIGDLPAQFSADVDSNEPAEQQWVTVAFQPGSTGESEGKLTLKTTHPDQPEVQVTLKARVQ